MEFLSKAIITFASAGAEYDIELNVAILESLNAHALRRGNISNDSTSNPVMELANVSRFPYEDIVDEGAEVEALEADIGKFINSSNDSDDSGRTINNIEPTESMPRLPVSSRGRPLKPTLKLLELSNATGDITLDRRPRGFLRRKGVAEPSGSRSVVGQASLANGMARQADVVDPNGSGAGVEVDVSEPL
nr:hypothetical protein [Tanacetum cinerariifolium]